MANLNLSQFGENTSVSDADYTFVWDSAASISKKVSRNSWLNSGTLTSSAPVTISQTWNAVGQTFKALVVNAAGTSDANSASGSKLLELQVGGAPVFSVSKGGGLRIPIGQFLSGYGIGWVNSGFYATNNSNIFGVSNNQAIVEFKPEGFQISSALSVSWGSIGSPADTILVRDSASGNTLALRNGALAQTFRVYNTYTDASNYERAVFGYGSNQINLGSDVAGSGVHRKLNILGAGIDFYHAGIGIRWSINTSGHFIAAADNTYDIGANGANRPRNVFVGGFVSAELGFGKSGVGGTTQGISFSGSSTNVNGGGNGAIVNLQDNSGNLYLSLTTGITRFGGTTASFPALKRSSTTLQARLADDSAFAPIQGKLTTETAFTATTVTPTGFITLYDSTGAAYKVPCVPA